jgi:predicted MFS family arabinose efflux permease
VYWAISTTFFICGITTVGFIESHFVALAVARGVTLQDAALAFGILSFCNGVGMIGAGYLSDRYSQRNLLALIFFVRGLSYVLLLFVNEIAGLVLFAVIFGLVDYAVVPCTCGLVASHFGEGMVGLGVGIILLWHSFGAAVGSYVGGVAYDAEAHYNTAIVACMSICFFASAVCFVVPELRESTALVVDI